MRLTESTLAGAWVIELEPVGDERGEFFRCFDAEQFAARGLDPRVVQCSVSRNRRAGTLRGMHYQAEPHAEAKLVRCSRGVVFDAIIDLRADSPSFCASFSLELTGELALYVPPGFAHGFQTLADECEVHYQMSAPYVPEASRGVRWDDPAFGIAWPPAARRTISARDAAYPDFRP
ncbi:MAG: dTDP-4-dehydrorhamnose 3,5-epimerase [Solirubrobacteraceae bacterium]